MEQKQTAIFIEAAIITIEQYFTIIHGSILNLKGTLKRDLFDNNSCKMV